MRALAEEEFRCQLLNLVDSAIDLAHDQPDAVAPEEADQEPQDPVPRRRLRPFGPPVRDPGQGLALRHQESDPWNRERRGAARQAEAELAGLALGHDRPEDVFRGAAEAEESEGHPNGHGAQNMGPGNPARRSPVEPRSDDGARRQSAGRRGARQPQGGADEVDRAARRALGYDHLDRAAPARKNRPPRCRSEPRADPALLSPAAVAHRGSPGADGRCRTTKATASTRSRHVPGRPATAEPRRTRRRPRQPRQGTVQQIIPWQGSATRRTVPGLEHPGQLRPGTGSRHGVPGAPRRSSDQEGRSACPRSGLRAARPAARSSRCQSRQPWRRKERRRRPSSPRPVGRQPRAQAAGGRRARGATRRTTRAVGKLVPERRPPDRVRRRICGADGDCPGGRGDASERVGSQNNSGSPSRPGPGSPTASGSTGLDGVCSTASSAPGRASTWAGSRPDTG